MASVYVETSIPSFYYETRKSPRITVWRDATRRWWDEHSVGYELVTSRFVIEELDRAPITKSRKAKKLLAKVDVLAEPPGLADVVRYYMKHRLMPVEAGGDAFHLAIASMHSVDFLLTWNCQHLANANKIQHISIVNRRLGLPVPILTTPLTLMPE